MTRAGCLFVGAGAATAFGDYVAGSNHVLPTDGAARFASGLSRAHFRRRMAEVRIPPKAAAALAPHGAALARAEGFEVHAESMEARIRREWQRDEPQRRRSTARPARPTCACRWRSTASGDGARETGVGFLDHMLDLLARHGRLDLDVAASGDLQTGAHHTVEDVGICLGQALDEALGDRAGIFRYGAATIPMDEARASCAIDVSGRAFLAFERRAAGRRDRRLRPRAGGGVLPRGREQREADAAPDASRRARTPTT